MSQGSHRGTAHPMPQKYADETLPVRRQGQFSTDHGAIALGAYLYGPGQGPAIDTTQIARYEPAQFVTGNSGTTGV